MANTPATSAVSRTRNWLVAALLTLGLLAATLLAQGWQRFLSVDDERIASGEPTPYLGITYIPLSHELAARYGLAIGEGILITDVAGASPAGKAGLRRSDVVISADSVPFTRPSSLVEMLSNRRPGDRILFQLLRDGKTVTAEVVLGANP